MSEAGYSNQETANETPRPRRSESRKLVGRAVAISAMLATGAAGFGVYTGQAALIGEHLRGDTAQSRQVSDMVYRAFGERMTIRCVDQFPGSYTIDTRARSHLDPMNVVNPVTYLHNRSCTTLIDMQNDPSLMPSKRAELDALLDLTHEYEHTKSDNPTLDEGEAQCLGVQHVLPLLETIGRNHEEAAAIQRKVAENIDIPASASTPSEYGIIPVECTPGLALDLGIPDATFPAVGHVG